MGASLFLGMFIGNVVSGLLEDRFSRKSMFIATCIMVMMTSLLASLAQDQIMLIMGRTLFGISAGFILPISVTLIVENTEGSFRAKIWIAGNFWWVTG